MCERESIHIEVEVLVPLQSKRIVALLEFFFSDARLQFDRFLSREIEKDDGGWVTVEVLMAVYNRQLARICGDAVLIAEAVRISPDSLVEVDGTNTKIRRKPGVPAESVAVERTVCCKGFPADATCDEVFRFAANLGDGVVTKVTPQSYRKGFRGPVHLTFVSSAEAKRFVNYRSVRYGGVELKRAWHEEYSDGRYQRTYNDFETGLFVKGDRPDTINDSVTSAEGIEDLFATLGYGVASPRISFEPKEARVQLKKSWGPAEDVLKKNRQREEPEDCRLRGFRRLFRGTAEETVLNDTAKP